MSLIIMVKKTDETKTKQEPKILIGKNGPYFITGNIPVIEEVILYNEDNVPLIFKNNIPR